VTKVASPLIRPLALVVALATLCAAACGGSGDGAALVPVAPSTGTSAQLTVPTAFLQTAQKVNAANNELSLSWTGVGTSYNLVIGRTSGAADILNTEVTGTTYTWTSPRTGGPYYARVAAKRDGVTTAFSDELSLYVVDVRDMVDALYFHAGPLSDAPSNANTNPVGWVFADGSRLSVLVSTEAGDTARANAQTFVDQYAALTGGAVTATLSTTSSTMRDQSPSALPEYTIGIRVQTGVCTEGALACANFGPAPGGTNRAFVNLPATGGLNLSAVAHEMGHAYGFGHTLTPISGRVELRFLMHPTLSAEQLTEAEKTAITFARQNGLRPGMRRNEALAAGLVNPFTGSASAFGSGDARPGGGRRDREGYIWIDGMRAWTMDFTNQKFSGVQ
jgi:hypothetical protein